MKWNVKIKVLPKPVPGEIRTITKFAFTPTLCDRNHKHWLENVLIRQWYGPSGTWWDFLYEHVECQCPDQTTPTHD